MINLFFVPGMFGSTIEFCIRNFSNEYQSKLENDLESYIRADGTLHSVTKELHLSSDKMPDVLTQYDSSSNAISTPIYPTQRKHFPEIIKTLYENSDFKNNKNVLLFADTLSAAELNLYFQYYKIATGDQHTGLKMGIDIFFDNRSNSITKWNPDATNWRELETWQLREWFSIFYTNWIQEWTESRQHIKVDFLSLSNVDFLYHTKDCLTRIFEHCNLTFNEKNIDNFINIWQNKQQYIVDSENLCRDIIANTMLQEDFAWDSTNIVQEAIIQKRLRDCGYGLKCWNLNKFPTNTEQLYNLLEKA